MAAISEPAAPDKVASANSGMVQTAMNLGMTKAMVARAVAPAASRAARGLLWRTRQAIARNNPDKVSIATIWLSQPAMNNPL